MSNGSHKMRAAFVLAPLGIVVNAEGQRFFDEGSMEMLAARDTSGVLVSQARQSIFGLTTQRVRINLRWSCDWS